jgi:hypothetical protein
VEEERNDNALDRLFAAARKAEFCKPDAELGFETRVVANIRARREGRSSFLLWAWRLIPVFVSIVIFLGIWFFAYEPNQQIDLSAISNVGSEDVTLTAFLTGE